jgi:hypothetical protein
MDGNGRGRVFRYGGDFAEARIARARGTCIYDADGARSWTSPPGR